MYKERSQQIAIFVFMKRETVTTVLIMAGGSGERFWPLSTKERPKQLLRLIDKKRSLIRMAVDRVLPMIPADRIFIATNSIQASAVMEKLPDIPKENIILEPLFKDTAAAIGFAAVIVSEIYPDSVMVVLASDHLIKDEESFRDSIRTAVNTAESEKAIVTLGIRPSYPETGFGYLKVGVPLKKVKGCTTMQEGVDKHFVTIGQPAVVEAFCEKPKLEVAQQYLNSGNYLWNSGMFIFKLAVMMDAFKRLMPQHYKILKEIKALGIEKRNEKNKTLKALFEKFTKISIDFGIMERFEKTYVVPVDFGWNDVGSYTALEELLPHNENNTVVQGTEIAELNSKENIIISTTGKKVSLLGIEGLVVVETADNILICNKSEVQNIKQLITNSKSNL